MMLPEDMRLWVGKDHLVWFVIDVVDGLDTSGLEALGRPGKGRPGYDPRMLAVLLVYAYLQGVRSSRRIEERCRTDAAFRVATGNQFPDHATVARFRAAAAGEGGPLEDLFLQVLFVLAVAGLGRLDVVSVDGSKIWANASKQANRTEGGLRKLARKVLEDAARSDGEGCGCRGHGHGDAAGPAGPGSCPCCDGGMLPRYPHWSILEIGMYENFSIFSNEVISGRVKHSGPSAPLHCSFLKLNLHSRWSQITPSRAPSEASHASITFFAAKSRLAGESHAPGSRNDSWTMIACSNCLRLSGSGGTPSGCPPMMTPS